MKHTVSVPATSANLGPGFDAIALALDVRDLVTAEIVDEPGVHVVLHGNGTESLPRDASHLVAQVIASTADAYGRVIAGLELECNNTIPQGRGMGSSAGAIIAGLVLARALLDLDMDDTELLRRANVIEGHPDNISACLLGGMTVAWWDSPEDVRATSLVVHPAVNALVAIPNAELSTSKARGMLPATVPYGDAVGNVSRTATLVAAMTSDPALLFDGTRDALHQEYRRAAYPQSMALVDALRAQGLAAAISGAGPSVLVLGVRADVDRAHHLVVEHEFQALNADITPRGAFLVHN